MSRYSFFKLPERTRFVSVNFKITLSGLDASAQMRNTKHLFLSSARSSRYNVSCSKRMESFLIRQRQCITLFSTLVGGSLKISLFVAIVITAR